jgi:tetratricopeptide (TPR) repeat protein
VTNLRLVLIGAALLGALHGVDVNAQKTPPSSDVRLVEGSTALYGGDPEKALRHAMEVLKERPDDVRARLLAARAHIAADRYAAAYDELRQAERADPRNVDVLYYLGIVAGHLATTEFDRLYALEPDGARVHQLMAESAKLQGRQADAAAEYERALSANPRLFEALIELGRIRREQSNCEAAIPLYERAQAIRSTLEGAYGLGACLVFQNEHRRAAEVLRVALTHDPRSAVAHLALGSALLHMGDAEPAVRELEQSVGLEPKLRQAHYLLGRAYRALGLEERSRQAFARADALAQAERLGDQKALGVDPPKPRDAAPPRDRL